MVTATMFNQYIVRCEAGWVLESWGSRSKQSSGFGRSTRLPPEIARTSVFRRIAGLSGDCRIDVFAASSLGTGGGVVSRAWPSAVVVIVAIVVESVPPMRGAERDENGVRPGLGDAIATRHKETGGDKSERKVGVYLCVSKSCCMPPFRGCCRLVWAAQRPKKTTQHGLR